MNKSDIVIGGRYFYNYHGIITVEVLDILETKPTPAYKVFMGRSARTRTWYSLRNLKTGRKIVAKSALKFIKVAPEGVFYAGAH